MSLQVQVMTLLTMFASGNVLGVMFDVYRVISNRIRLWRILVHVCDLLYWVIATVLVFRFLYMSNQGEVRFYIFVGLVFGTCFYYYMVSNLVVSVVQRTISLLIKIMDGTLKLLHLTLVRPLLFLFRLIVAIVRFFGVAAMFFFGIVLQCINGIRTFLWWMLTPLHPYIRIPARWLRVWNRFWRWVKRIFRNT